MNILVFDCEVYPNYFLIAYKNIETNKTAYIECVGKNTTLTKQDKNTLAYLFKNRILVGFNSDNYDLPIIMYAMNNATCDDIYNLSKSIIDNNLKKWQTVKIHMISYLNNINHIDLQNIVTTVRVSLKALGSRLNTEKLQDLPFNPTLELDSEQINIVRNYCLNDLNITKDVFNFVKKEYDIRKDLSKLYNVDLTNKSRAQISEQIIKHELSKISYVTYNNQIKQEYCYKAPKNVIFHSKQLQDLKELIEKSIFVLDNKGSLKLPKELSKIKIQINNTSYKVGIGGLHSQEKNIVYQSNEDYIIIDKDVVSYYPSLIINLNYYPEHLGSNFLTIYKNLVEKRILAKKNKNEILNNCLKIVINGAFGKFGSKYSILYSPQLLLNITITGQLYLLMLIEMLENNSNFEIISANTDGIVCRINKNYEKNFINIVKEWEQITNLETEGGVFSKYIARDVNNYIAIRDNKIKCKGIFSILDLNIIETLSKNLDKTICIKAIIEYVKNKTSIEYTIKNCKDIKEFLVCRKASKGATYNGNYLGKQIRWVHIKEGKDLRCNETGNKIAGSNSCLPIMNLNEIPSNIYELIDYDYYIDFCNKILLNLKI